MQTGYMNYMAVGQPVRTGANEAIALYRRFTMKMTH
jgi:hypothetical protein